MVGTDGVATFGFAFGAAVVVATSVSARNTHRGRIRQFHHGGVHRVQNLLCVLLTRQPDLFGAWLPPLLFTLYLITTWVAMTLLSAGAAVDKSATLADT